MPDETLQVAFEIKTACDEISRKLLRWHWERKPGAHSLNALLEHIAQRQQRDAHLLRQVQYAAGGIVKAKGKAVHIVSPFRLTGRFTDTGQTTY